VVPIPPSFGALEKRIVPPFFLFFFPFLPRLKLDSVLVPLLLFFDTITLFLVGLAQT